MNSNEFERTIEDLFDHEKRFLRAPQDMEARVMSAIETADRQPESRRWTLRPVLAVAAAVAAVGVAGILSVAVLLSGGSDSGPAVEPGTIQEPPGPPVPQVAEQPLVHDYGEYLSVRSHTFERGPAALEAAVDIMPFPVSPPTYVPQGLRASHVAARVTTDINPRGSLLTGYTVPADGTWQPYLGISWIDREIGDYPPRDHQTEEGFQAGGYVWDVNVYQWRDGNSIEAVTTRDDGVSVFVDLRVAGGLDHDQTLEELKKVVASMTPADER